MDIVIYGCGNLGQYVFKQITTEAQEKKNIKIKCWIDNYANDKTVYGLPVISEKKFLKSNKCGSNNMVVLIAIMDQETSQKKAISLHINNVDVLLLHPKTYEAKLPIIDKKGDFTPYVFNYGEKLPILPYVEFQVADQCNLNCKACMHFSNLVKEPKFASVAEFRESLVAIASKFRTIKTIRLMGGEPLLNPRLPDFIDAARMYFPNADIRVVTNGLLITKISEELLRIMKQEYIIFDITQYPPVRERLNEMVAFLDSNNLNYILPEPVEKFIIRLSKGTEDAERVFNEKCLSRMCTFLRKRRLFICPHIPMLFEQQEYFDFRIDKDELLENSIDIFDSTITGWQVLERFEQSFSMCRFCSMKPSNIDWKCGTANKEDWIA